jgi:hypothetical protein
MKRSSRGFSRRGRPPSLDVAARKTNKLRQNVREVLDELEDLEARLRRLESLLVASRQADKERAKQRAAEHKGLRGKGPNVRDVAYQILARRRRPMEIQEISAQVLKMKKGSPGGNFTQNLGAALARDSRFVRVGRGMYTVKR